MANGTIAVLDPKKAYVVIESRDGKQYTGWADDSSRFTELEVGQSVTFEIGTNSEGGPIAKNITPS
ncbi:hypothetical protein C4K00_3986 [Pseudomonas synxantha]|uniref:cold shock domain-containing protein n=1 Tax=Pseudomonas synxantha TaxID=47883 RepID=UPI000F717279|nr:cold shock domain-containing protein [Pseudomonas synxantha]AZE74198.1 hypothetical protein C4K00_3986 [Pseudomonas synxantha]